MMRCMLVANMAVDNRFANGTQGRLLHWHPESVGSKKKLSASYHDLLVRFAKESSLSKREMFPDIDHMDITARQESLAIRGDVILLQMPLTPSYGLTIHKVQALSIKHLVLGCVEGIFAQGQVYVSWRYIVNIFSVIGLQRLGFFSGGRIGTSLPPLRVFPKLGNLPVPKSS